MRFETPAGQVAFEIPDDWWFFTEMDNFSLEGHRFYAYPLHARSVDVVPLSDVEPPMRNSGVPPIQKIQDGTHPVRLVVAGVCSAPCRGRRFGGTGRTSVQSPQWISPVLCIGRSGLSLAACRDPSIMNQLIPISSPALPVAAAGARASMRFLEFFAANIRNAHTRRVYARAAEEFLAWCASAGVPSIGAPCCIGASGGAGAWRGVPRYERR